MFRHVVLLRFVDDATDEQRDEIVERLRRLPGQVPEIRHYVVGVDAGLAPGNATVAVVADFDDEAGYLVYAAHPAHLAVITEQIQPILAARAAVQHPVEDGV